MKRGVNGNEISSVSALRTQSFETTIEKGGAVVYFAWICAAWFQKSSKDRPKAGTVQYMRVGLGYSKEPPRLLARMAGREVSPGEVKPPAPRFCED